MVLSVVHGLSEVPVAMGERTRVGQPQHGDSERNHEQMGVAGIQGASAGSRLTRVLRGPEGSGVPG